MKITIRPTRQDDPPNVVDIGSQFGRERKVAGENF